MTCLPFFTTEIVLPIIFSNKKFDLKSVKYFIRERWQTHTKRDKERRSVCKHSWNTLKFQLEKTNKKVPIKQQKSFKNSKKVFQYKGLGFGYSYRVSM